MTAGVATKHPPPETLVDRFVRTGFRPATDWIGTLDDASKCAKRLRAGNVLAKISFRHFEEGAELRRYYRVWVSDGQAPEASCAGCVCDPCVCVED